MIHLLSFKDTHLIDFLGVIIFLSVFIRITSCIRSLEGKDMSRSGAQGVGATTWPAGRCQEHPPQQGVAPGPLTSQLTGTSPMEHSMHSSHNIHLLRARLGQAQLNAGGRKGTREKPAQPLAIGWCSSNPGSGRFLWGYARAIPVTKCQILRKGKQEVSNVTNTPVTVTTLTKANTVTTASPCWKR